MLTRKFIEDKIQEKNNENVYNACLIELNKFIDGHYNSDILSCITKKEERFFKVIGTYDFRHCGSLLSRLYVFYNLNKEKFGNNYIDFNDEFNKDKKCYEVYIIVKLH